MLHGIDTFLLNGAIPVPSTLRCAYFSLPWPLLAKLLVWMPFSSFQLQMSWIYKNVMFELVKLARLNWLSWKVSGRHTVMSYRDQVETNWTVLSGRYDIRDMIWYDICQIQYVLTWIANQFIYVCLNLMSNISAKLDRPEQSQNKRF